MTQDRPVILVADRMRDMSLVSNPSNVRRVYRHGRRVVYREGEIGTVTDPDRIGRYARLSVYYGEIYLHLANGGAEDWRTKIPTPPPAHFIVRPGEYWIAGPFKTGEIPSSWLGAYSSGNVIPPNWVTAPPPDPAVAVAFAGTPADFRGRI